MTLDTAEIACTVYADNLDQPLGTTYRKGEAENGLRGKRCNHSHCRKGNGANGTIRETGLANRTVICLIPVLIFADRLPL